MKNVFNFFHIPMDNYIYNAVKKQLGIKIPKKRWSRIDTYEEYMDYQEEIWEKIKGQLPIEWEIFNWLEEAKNQNPI